jgi:hypothetical protein
VDPASVTGDKVPALFTVELTGGMSSQLFVTVEARDSVKSLSWPKNFLDSNNQGTVVFVAGSATSTIGVTSTNTAGTVTLSILSSPDYAVGTPSSVTLTVIVSMVLQAQGIADQGMRCTLPINRS